MALTPQNTKQSKSTQLHDYRHIMLIRMLLFCVAAINVTTYFVLQGERLQLILVFALLCYPVLTRRLLHLTLNSSNGGFRRMLLPTLDGLAIGLAIIGVHIALVPTLAIATAAVSCMLIIGGVRLWLWSLISITTTLAIGITAFPGLHITLEAQPWHIAVIALVSLALYVNVAATYTLQQSRKLAQSHQRLAKQQRQAVELTKQIAKYVPPQVWGQLFSGRRQARIQTRRKFLTVFFSDIQDFSAMSETLPLGRLTRLLNTYLEEMTRIALRYGGTVDKFIGDAIMIFFGDPVSRSNEEDAFNCVAMALEMQQQMLILRQRWQREGIADEFHVRMGINSGHVTVGNFGTSARMDYTILGSDVNLASRLESLAKPGQVLISESTYHLVKTRIRCRHVGNVTVKGFQKPIPVYAALELASRAGEKRFTSIQTAGFALHLDVRRIRNYDRNRVLRVIAQSAKQLRTSATLDFSYETEGFAVYIDSSKLREKDISQALDQLEAAAKSIQKHKAFAP